jgi:hypothetical protein
MNAQPNTLSPKEQMLASDRAYMTALIRRAVGKCEGCGRVKEFKFRPCLVCVPVL